MPKEMVASIVAQDLQNMTHWGGIRANIQCTLASKSKLRSIVESREKSRQEEEQDVSFPKQQQVNTQMSMEEMMGKMIGKGDELPISCHQQVAVGLQGPRGM